MRNPSSFSLVSVQETSIAQPPPSAVSAKPTPPGAGKGGGSRSIARAHNSGRKRQLKSTGKSRPSSESSAAGSTSLSPPGAGGGSGGSMRGISPSPPSAGAPAES